jgi:hypothetical protein
LTVKLTPWPGLRRPTSALVHVGVDVDGAEVLGDGEERRSGERGGHRLAELHLALHHHAVHGRADLRAAEIDLDVPELRFPRQDDGLGAEHVRFGERRVGLQAALLGLDGGDVGLRRGEPRLQHLGRRAGGVERRLRADVARGEFRLALQRAAGLGELRRDPVALGIPVAQGRLGFQARGAAAFDAGAAHGEIGPGLLQVGAGRVATGADLVGEQPGDEFALPHRRVVIGQDLHHETRELGRD